MVEFILICNASMSYNILAGPGQIMGNCGRLWKLKQVKINNNYCDEEKKRTGMRSTEDTQLSMLFYV